MRPPARAIYAGQDRPHCQDIYDIGIRLERLFIFHLASGSAEAGEHIASSVPGYDGVSWAELSKGSNPRKRIKSAIVTIDNARTAPISGCFDQSVAISLH